MQIMVIGLGYVGLPLAVEFGKKYPTFGIDTCLDRIEQLKIGYDFNNELSAQEISEASLLNFSSMNFKRTEVLIDNQKVVYIITVPTPLDKYKKPDLSMLLKATKDVGMILKKGDVVIFESTVYPGCTEGECVPVLELHSGLIFNEDFFCGYSPERINTGDKVHSLSNIIKITSGSTPDTADFIDDLYKSIVLAGTFKAPSIKVAEAAKLIENCQRDVNISFVNELALIFDRLGIDTNDVLEAAETKWNFAKYKPGLVGGHCIGIDPHYLIYIAQSVGYFPQVVLAGRNVNDQIGIFIASKVVKLMIKEGLLIKSAKILILGIAFKENCSDVRNSKAVDVYNEFKDYEMEVDVYDPRVSAINVYNEHRIRMISELKMERIYSAIVLTVAHDEFLDLNLDELRLANGIIFDTKAVLDRKIVQGRL